jgi:hypothetical protein
MLLIKKLIPLVVSLLMLMAVAIYVTPPKTLNDASISQLLLFFVPLLLLLISATNLLFNFWPHSIITGSGLTVLILLYGLDQFNPLYVIAIIAAVILMFRLIKKPRSLAYQPRIPKLSRLEKQR